MHKIDYVGENDIDMIEVDVFQIRLYVQRTLTGSSKKMLPDLVKIGKLL